MLKLPKITSLLFLCNIIRKKWVMKLIFYIQISLKISYKFILWFLKGTVKHSQSFQNNDFAMSLQYLKKRIWDEVFFLHEDKHQSFIQVECNTLGVKVSYKVILSLLMDMIKHFQSFKSNKFAISLQYLKKEVRNEVHFLHTDKHQNFYKLALPFFDGKSQTSKAPKIPKIGSS